MVIQTFDTITEMVQGPCKANQIAIANSKFLEFAVLVLSEDERIFEVASEGNQPPHYKRKEQKMRFSDAS